MGQLVKPKVYFVGCTDVREEGLKEYLQDTGQMAFWDDYRAARDEGLKPGEALCSVYAKLCYKSLVLGKNANVSRIRGVRSNLEGCHDTGHGCYDAETEVLTSLGWKAWPDVTKDDLLASLDEDGGLVYVKPVEVRSFVYSGRMYRVESQGVDLLVTPNHKMYVCPTTTRTGRKRGEFCLIPAETLGTTSHAYIKVAKKWEPKEVHGYSTNFLRFLGFVIGAGSYQGDSLVRFRLRHSCKSEWLKQVVGDLAVEQVGQWSIEFDGKAIYTVKIPESAIDVLRQIYRDGQKCIPQHILMTAGREQLKGLLEGLVRSYGHDGSMRRFFDTASSFLAGQVQQLCLHCGIAASALPIYGGEDRLRALGAKLTRLSILSRNFRPEVNRYVEQKGKSYWIENWAGVVFCAQMPDETQHVLYVRRNGKSVWCGNSVFEHCQLNFLVTNCSRVFTHEQVRHRVGWAYSQTSGRYCRLDKIDLVWSDLLDPVKDKWLKHLAATERLVYETECELGLRKPPPDMPDVPYDECFKSAGDGMDWTSSKAMWVPDNSFDFDKRKALTSAIRRIVPNGQANEIGMSCNIRALRHAVQLRTSRFAETEIRDVYAQIFRLVKDEYPTIFYKARTRMYDGIPEVYGMRMQPYEIEAGDPRALEYWDSATLRAELRRREGPDLVAGNSS